MMLKNYALIVNLLWYSSLYSKASFMRRSFKQHLHLYDVLVWSQCIPIRIIVKIYPLYDAQIVYTPFFDFVHVVF